MRSHYITTFLNYHRTPLDGFSIDISDDTSVKITDIVGIRAWLVLALSTAGKIMRRTVTSHVLNMHPIA